MTTSDNTTPHKAVDYDISIRQTIPFYETIQSETVDLVKTIKPDVSCWLDTGCGTGYLEQIALPYFPQTSFILTDPSASMLKQAMIRMPGLPEKRIKYLSPTRSENLDIYKEEMHPQVITAMLCHHYLQKPQRLRAAQVCCQLLDLNGLFITVENITPVTPHCISLGLERWKRFQVEHGRAKTVVEEHSKRFNTEYFPISIEEHLNLLRETGFKSVNLFWLSHMQAGFYAIK
jgi:tRNA (cmo5U34)-methyltransferase